MACRRAVTILLFTIFQLAARPILLWKGFCQFFSFPYCFLTNWKLSLSFNTNLKRNLVSASPRSLLARRRVTFGTSTGSYYFTIYCYFPARSPSNTTLWLRFLNFFPSPYCILKNLKLSLSFNTNLKRNLVLASPKSILARRRVTLGTSTGHFWHVDGQLLFYYLLFSSLQPVQYYFE